ncbi:MAG: TIGR03435 family protein, partial [Terriglobia bacterium]
MKARSGFAPTLAVSLLLAIGAAFGQTAPSNLAFEVATVKPSPPLDMAKMREQIQAGRMPRFGPHVTASQAEYTYMTLKDLIATAYKVKSYQISGPDWLATEHFDIVGKIPDGASKDDAPTMLEALLADRFKLAAHRDTKEQQVLALLVGKDGPKLKDSPAAPPPIDENAPLKPGETKIDTPDGQVRMMRNPDGSMTINRGAKGTFTQRMDMQAQMMTLESSQTTMSGFADMLTAIMQMGNAGGRQVVDMTGLKGNYQVALDLSLADLMAMARAQGMNLPAAAPGGAGADASP